MKRIMICTLIGATGIVLSACSDSKKDSPPAVNQTPGFIQGDIATPSMTASPMIF